MRCNAINRLKKIWKVNQTKGRKKERKKDNGRKKEREKEMEKKIKKIEKPANLKIM